MYIKQHAMLTYFYKSMLDLNDCQQKPVLLHSKVSPHCDFKHSDVEDWHKVGQTLELERAVPMRRLNAASWTCLVAEIICTRRPFYRKNHITLVLKDVQCGHL